MLRLKYIYSYKKIDTFDILSFPIELILSDYVFLIFRDRFHYFKAEDDRWKNSVRHNLSMNPHFRKGGKAKQGSGHLWVLADYDKEESLSQIQPQTTRQQNPSIISNGENHVNTVSLSSTVAGMKGPCSSLTSSIESYGHKDITYKVCYE